MQSYSLRYASYASTPSVWDTYLTTSSAILSANFPTLVPPNFWTIQPNSGFVLPWRLPFDATPLDKEDRIVGRDEVGRVTDLHFNFPRGEFLDFITVVTAGLRKTAASERRKGKRSARSEREIKSVTKGSRARSHGLLSREVAGMNTRKT